MLPKGFGCICGLERVDTIITDYRSKTQTEQLSYTLLQFPGFEIGYYPEALLAKVYITAPSYREMTSLRSFVGALRTTLQILSKSHFSQSGVGYGFLSDALIDGRRFQEYLGIAVSVRLQPER